jgi:hypothetical protein
VTSTTTTWIRPLTEATAGIPTPREIRGSHCRTAQGLFTEWAAGLSFPDYFGHNWDAFRDCLREVVDNADDDVAVLLREAGELLDDEPPNTLAILLTVLREAAAGDDPVAPGLLLILDDAPDHLPGLAQRMAEAGYPVDLGKGPKGARGWGQDRPRSI